VEVGGGTGDHAALLQLRGIETYNIELNRRLCEEARARHPRLNVIHGDMLEVFDLVRGPLRLAYCIGGTLNELRALDEVRDVVQQLCDLARPGGTVVLDVPNVGPTAPETALRLTREGLEATLPSDCTAKWQGDWNGSEWSADCSRTIVVLRPA
jgi:SAM-dependent methyltransferase